MGNTEKESRGECPQRPRAKQVPGVCFLGDPLSSACPGVSFIFLSSVFSLPSVLCIWNFTKFFLNKWSEI